MSWFCSNSPLLGMVKHGKCSVVIAEKDTTAAVLSRLLPMNIDGSHRQTGRQTDRQANGREIPSNSISGLKTHILKLSNDNNITFIFINCKFCVLCYNVTLITTLVNDSASAMGLRTWLWVYSSPVITKNSRTRKHVPGKSHISSDCVIFWKIGSPHGTHITSR